eukprot:595657-Lingulodinium_polyedra.AAC.1
MFQAAGGSAASAFAQAGVSSFAQSSNSVVEGSVFSKQLEDAKQAEDDNTPTKKKRKVDIE